MIEVGASAAAIWRLQSDIDAERRERAERLTLHIVGILFLALAVYVAYDAGDALLGREAPEESPIGIALAAASLIVMPLLVRAKRRVARELGSEALEAEASQTLMCTYLSAVLLGGLMLNALLGWWWADPLAALAMVLLIAREGLEAVRGRNPCRDNCL